MAKKVKVKGKVTKPKTSAATIDAKIRANIEQLEANMREHLILERSVPFGSFGKLISFSVSSKKILTFESLQREGEARWKKHEIIGKKPRMQFLGPDANTISLTIVLDARHGVKPLSTIKKIISARDKGKANYLIIKGKKVCANKMVITKTSDTWAEVWSKGELIRATMEMTLQEYR